MTVKELIEQLSKFHPESEVLGMCTDPTGYTYKNQIQDIEIGSPFDSNGYSGIDDEELDWGEHYDEDEETGEDIYIGPLVVLVNIGRV